MNAARAYNLFLFAAREGADEQQLAKIEDALTPPATYRHNGAPVWWKGDDDAWDGWASQMG